MSRTPVLIADHINGIKDHLDTILNNLTFPVFMGFGERPVKSDKSFYDPPYGVISYVFGGGLDGPISDSQADVELRILINSMGNTALESTTLRDLIHVEMSDKSNFTITNRKIRTIKLEFTSDGTYRDDDAPSPIFYTRQIYTLDTVPI